MQSQLVIAKGATVIQIVAKDLKTRSRSHYIRIQTSPKGLTDSPVNLPINTDEHSYREIRGVQDHKLIVTIDLEQSIVDLDYNAYSRLV